MIHSHLHDILLLKGLGKGNDKVYSPPTGQGHGAGDHVFSWARHLSSTFDDLCASFTRIFPALPRLTHIYTSTLVLGVHGHRAGDNVFS